MAQQHTSEHRSLPARVGYHFSLDCRALDVLPNNDLPLLPRHVTFPLLIFTEPCTPLLPNLSICHNDLHLAPSSYPNTSLNHAAGRPACFVVQDQVHTAQSSNGFMRS